jgi:hypothetical protein
MKKRSIFALGLQAGLAGLLVLLAGCASIWVKSAASICIQVRQSFEHTTGHSEPIAEELQGILERMGIKATIGAGADCQANLALSMNFTPILESVSGAGDCYLDASMSGQATLSSRGHLPSMLSLQHPRAVQSGYGVRLVYSCPKDPAKAPFVSAWAEPVITMLRKWWGGPALVSALKADTYALRSYAVEQIPGTGPAAIPALIELLGDPNTQTCASAARALGSYGKAAAQAVPALIERLNDPDSPVRQSAIEALGKIGDSRTVPVLVQALQQSDHKDINADEAAIDALGAIGPEAKPAIPKLIEMLNMDYYWAIRSAAASALKKITGQNLGEDAAAWQQWYAVQPQP